MRSLQGNSHQWWKGSDIAEFARCILFLLLLGYNTIKQHTPNLKRCTNLPPVLVFLVQIVVRTSRNSHDCCFQALINFVVTTTTTTEVPPFNSSHWTIKGEKKKGCSALSFFNLTHTERSCKNMRRNWKKTLLSVWALSEDSLEVLYLSISILCYFILPLNDISEVKYCIDTVLQLKSLVTLQIKLLQESKVRTVRLACDRVSLNLK